MAVNPNVTPGAKKPAAATQPNAPAQQQTQQQQLNNAWVQQAANNSMTDAARQINTAMQSQPQPRVRDGANPSQQIQKPTRVYDGATGAKQVQAARQAQPQSDYVWDQAKWDKDNAEGRVRIGMYIDKDGNPRSHYHVPTQQTQPSAQTQKDATTTQQASGGIYKVGDNGQAPKGLKVGDQVVTGGGTYTITGVNADGTYTSKLTNANQTTKNYTGQYSTLGGTTTQTAQQPSYAARYDANVNYDDEIRKAVNAGDLAAAAILEQARNAKIDALGLGDKYAKTSTYAQYLEGVDPARAAQLVSGYAEAPINFPDVQPGAYRDILEQWRQATIDQANGQIDYATEQGVTELKRAEEDAQPLFDKRLSQLDIDTARALANSAMYAEARGDRGGIGQSQYNEVQAQALANKQAIQAERTKLTTDTARQIADLRAKGDFQKADALLEVGQQYLSKLFELEQWLVNVGMSKAEFEQAKKQADLQYQLQVANITGEFNGQPTWSAKKYDQETAANLVDSMLSAGLNPGAELLKAAGFSAYSGDIARLVNQLTGMSFSGGRGSGSSNAGVGGYGPAASEDNNAAAFDAARQAILNEIYSSGDSNSNGNYVVPTDGTGGGNVGGETGGATLPKNPSRFTQ